MCEEVEDIKFDLNSTNIKIELDQTSDNFSAGDRTVHCPDSECTSENKTLKNEGIVEVKCEIEKFDSIYANDSSFNASVSNSLYDVFNHQGSDQKLNIKVICEESESQEDSDSELNNSSDKITKTLSSMSYCNSVETFIENNPQIFDQIRNYVKPPCSKLSNFSCDKQLVNQIENEKSNGIYSNYDIVHVCKYCNNYYKSKGDAKRHIEAFHFNFKPYYCNFCESNFTRKSSLQKHLKKFHERDESLRCFICSFRAGSKYVLKRHISGVHEIREDAESNFCCYYCSFTSKYKESIRLHIIRRHITMYSVKSCKISANKNNYVKNKNKRRLFQFCPECDYQAKDKTRLEGHINSKHKKIKPHCCSLCSYSSAFKEHLRAHVLVKHGYKFKCNQCSYSFQTKSSLSKHCSKFHNIPLSGKKIICHYCYEIHTCKKNLLNHIKQLHYSKFN